MAKKKVQTIDVTILDKDITINSKTKNTGIYFKNLTDFSDLTFEGATETHSNTDDLTITVNGHKVVLKDYFAKNGKFPINTITTDSTETPSVNILNYVNENYIRGAKQEIVNGMTKKINGTIFDDVISPLGNNQIINAGKGNDLIYADIGNDTMIGGLGTNEILYKYLKDPSELFPQKTFGKDTINLTKGETLYLNVKYNDNNSTNVALTYKKGTSKGANDLIIANQANENDSITIKNYYGKETGATVYINGQNLTTDTADFLAFDEDNVVKSKITGSALADVIDASDVEQQYKTVKKKGKKVQVETNLLISAGAGDDDITGSEFNDTITGGKGENTIHYNVESTFGHDVINLTKGETLNLSFTTEGGSEIDIYALRYSHGTGKKGKNDLIISLDNDNSVTIKNYYGKDTGAKVLINESDLTTYFREGLKTPDNKIFNEFKITDENKVKSVTGSALADKIDAIGLTNPIKVKKGVQYGVTINAGAGNDNVIGSDFNDTINGGAGVDNLKGGAGNDTIKGGAGDDIITGGKDNDKLYGEAGKNTFIFNAGDGNDTIYQGKGTDTLQFNDIDLSTLKLEQGKKKNNKDLIIKYGENDSVTVKNYYTVNKKGKITGVNKKNSVKNITTNGANIVMGTPAAETFDGTEGRDVIFANGGNDVINASTGDDDIHLGSGNSTVKFDMSMLAVEVHDEGTDWEWRECTENCVKTIYLSDDKNSTVTLDFDKEIFENGCGIFCRGTGQDRNLYISLTNADDPAYSIVIKDYFDAKGNPRTNQVKLNIWEYPEIFAEDRVQVTYTVPEYATEVEFPWVRTFDVQPFGPYTGEIHGTNMPNEVLLYSAGLGDDTIYGGNGNRELICLHGGNDTVYSNEGTKNVSIWGNQTNVELYLGSDKTTKTNINLGLVEGNVTSSINDAGDLNVSWDCQADSTDDTYTSTLRVNKWNSRTSEATFSIGGNNRDNTLNAINGVANTLNGGGGDDILVGGSGVDTFNFTCNSEYGIDTVKNYASDDILRFESASTADVDFSKFKYYTNNDGKGLVINIKDLSNKDSYVIIDNYFDSDNKIDKVIAYNWESPDEERTLSTMYGNKSDLGSFDLATGGEYTGTNNNDILIGKSGTNVLTGGKGTDALYTQGGENTFVFNAGDGSDTLYQEGGSVTLRFNDATIDALAAKTGYDKDTAYYDDLLIHYDGENTLRVKDYYYNRKNCTVKIIDSTGTEYNMADYFKPVKYIASVSDYYMYPPTNKDDDIRITSDTAGVNVIDGEGGSDTIWGSNADETIFSHKTDYSYDTTSGVVDIIHAGGGDDVIYAWSDTNIVYGDAGDDTIFVNVGQKSIISDSSGTADALSINPVVDGTDVADYDKMHFVFNVKSDGEVDDAGLRILTDDEYSLWQTNTNHTDIKGINIVKDSQGNGGYNCIETFIDANDKELSMSAIETVKGDIASWLSDEGYGSVSGVFGNALEKSAEDSAADIATLVAKFDSIQTKWS